MGRTRACRTDKVFPNSSSASACASKCVQNSVFYGSISGVEASKANCVPNSVRPESEKPCSGSEGFTAFEIEKRYDAAGVVIPQEQAQRKKEALAECVEKLSRVRILEAIRKKLRGSPSARLGDGSPRLFPAFGPLQSPASCQALRIRRKEE